MRRILLMIAAAWAFFRVSMLFGREKQKREDLEEQLEAVDETNAVRDKLRNDPDEFERVRDKHQRD